MSRRREIPLSEWAARQSMSLRTAQRKANKGDLPVPTRVNDSGRYMVFVDADEFPEHVSPEDVMNMLHRLVARMDHIEAKLDAVLVKG